MDAWIFGAAVVGGAVLFSSLGVVLVRRQMVIGNLKKHHEVAGYLLSIVGTLYSVLLGLIVVETQTKFDQAIAMSRQEADSCLDMFHLAYAFPMPVRKKLHTYLQEYLQTLVDKEWDSVNEEGAFQQIAKHPFRNICWTLLDFDPQTAKEQQVYEKYLDNIEELADGRRYRLQVAHAGLPSVLWGVLIAGGALTVLFTYFFEVEDAWAQILMTALVSLALSLNVLLVALFNNPYKGFLRISSYSFKYDLKVTKELLQERPDP
ncbi:MAG: DUF4239 domain-containing protein [Candidatus Obscuribacterales bacterium]|nr:DUF4239 domain-containing protein [Cyanobacteria bacterium SZAS LIN-5]RTL38540.1 MAG: DUF4239 domain-containing protein [Candidatus Melainabacteria bacterium]